MADCLEDTTECSSGCKLVVKLSAIIKCVLLIGRIVAHLVMIAVQAALTYIYEMETAMNCVIIKPVNSMNEIVFNPVQAVLFLI